MHKIFITGGLVLGKRGVGEANTSVFILTEHLGLIRASARSARREKSKLRYGLEPMTTARFSFVKGIYEWRCIGVMDHSRVMLGALLPARAAAGRIAKLVLRLVQGEEYAPALYKTIVEGFFLLTQAKEREEIESIECVLVLRILFNLGYLPKTPEIAPFLAEKELSVGIAAEAARSRSALIKAINESLLETGL